MRTADDRLAGGTGRHLIVDLHGARDLDDIDAIRAALREMVAATGATLLNEYLHRFEPCGITGVACLAESHISVHTWPERGLAAFDLFLCGDVDPELALPALMRRFRPQRVVKKTIPRGAETTP